MPTPPQKPSPPLLRPIVVLLPASSSAPKMTPQCNFLCHERSSNWTTLSAKFQILMLIPAARENWRCKAISTNTFRTRTNPWRRCSGWTKFKKKNLAHCTQFWDKFKNYLSEGLGLHLGQNFWKGCVTKMCRSCFSTNVWRYSLTT